MPRFEHSCMSMWSNPVERVAINLTRGSLASARASNLVFARAKQEMISHCAAFSRFSSSSSPQKTSLNCLRLFLKYSSSSRVASKKAIEIFFISLHRYFRVHDPRAAPVGNHGVEVQALDFFLRFEQARCFQQQFDDFGFAGFLGAEPLLREVSARLRFCNHFPCVLPRYRANADGKVLEQFRCDSAASEQNSFAEDRVFFSPDYEFGSLELALQDEPPLFSIKPLLQCVFFQAPGGFVKLLEIVQIERDELFLGLVEHSFSGDLQNPRLGEQRAFLHDFVRRGAVKAFRALNAELFQEFFRAFEVQQLRMHYCISRKGNKKTGLHFTSISKSLKISAVVKAIMTSMNPIKSKTLYTSSESAFLALENFIASAPAALQHTHGISV